MPFTSLVLRIWWEPERGFRALLRALHSQEPLYFKSLEELSQYLHAQALHLQQIQGESETEP